MGVERGIDHVGTLVRLQNFDAESNIFARLGFSLTGVLQSPAGIENRLIWMKDRSYLEIDAFTESNDATAPFLDFLQHHEGAKFFGTAVQDATAAATFLTDAGYPNVGPIPAGPLTVAATGQVVGTTPLWEEEHPHLPDRARQLDLLPGVRRRRGAAAVHRDSVAGAQAAPQHRPEDRHGLAGGSRIWTPPSVFYEGLGFDVHSKHKRIAYWGRAARR